MVVGVLAEACGPSGARHAPASFGVVFETGYGERVDTFRGLVTKGLVVGRDTTIALVLTGAELDLIYPKVVEVHLFELPELRAPTGCSMVPSTWPRLAVRADTRERRFRWEYWWACSDSLRGTKSWKGLMSVVGTIRGIVRARPEYRALPPPRGARI